MITGGIAAAHAAMTKEDVRAATGWVGVIILSPILGALIYLVAGINRIRHAALATRRGARRSLLSEADTHVLGREDIAELFGRQFMALNRLGDTITRFFMTTGNSIELLATGDAAYAEICRAIDEAEQSIVVESYIFDRDRIGLRVADRLIAAFKRGVDVRVLIDAVGARYSTPSIIGHFEEAGVPVDAFNGNVIKGLRLPYANLRTHRKIIVIDGKVGFTGGMNIREGFAGEFAGSNFSRDTHFKLTGPVVRDLQTVALEDWHFASGEKPDFPSPNGINPSEPTSPRYIRVVSSGPDAGLETNHKMLLGAFSIARSTVRIMSPYFLPDRELISAMVTAARRGVEIDILIPQDNNLKLVDRAMSAQFDQLLRYGCRIWRVGGTFNHSKLLTIDGTWSYVGTSNLDPRSLRLNFEVDLEILDWEFAAEIERLADEAMRKATEVTLDSWRARPFALRLLEKLVWLGSPYL
nr:cardiolipin synthase [Rhizobium setariae]